MVGDMVRVPYAYCYRCAYHLQYPDCDIACVDAIEDHFKKYADPASVAAVLVEPVLGEGGFVVPPLEYFNKLAALCRRHGILVIADEVQSGMGRTGRLFACEHFGLEPDLLVTAKSLAGGLPLAAVIGRADVMDSPGVGGSGQHIRRQSAGGGRSTRGARHVRADCSAAAGRSDRRAHRPARREVGRRVSAGRRRAQTGRDGRGGAGARPDDARAGQRGSDPSPAAGRGARSADDRRRYLGNVIRVLVPLVVSDEELDEGLDVIEACLSETFAEVPHKP